MERIGPYRITGTLGTGGMGVVYRAEHEDGGRPAAVKTVRALRGRPLAAIRREVLALSRLSHPGVVRIVDHGVQGGLPWYAMELLEGETLLSRGKALWRGRAAPSSAQAYAQETARDQRTRTLGDGATPTTAPMPPGLLVPPAGVVLAEPPRLPPPEALRPPAAGGQLRELLGVVRRLCHTLGYLHGQGVVHCDLKPENVFLLGDGAPVLVDFGIMSDFRGGSGRERIEPAREGMGTPPYMSPEQLRGQFLDARTDLYSLGVVLYWLVTGVLPFEGSKRDVIWQHLSAPVTPPSRLVSGVPQALEELILRLLVKDRHQRLGYAEDAATVLAELGADGAPGEGWPPARPYLYRPQLVGREELLARFDGFRESLARREGALLFVGGESGIGKTRFAMEVTRGHVGGRVITAECQPPAGGGEGPRSAPLQAWKPVLVAIADLCAAAGAEVTEEVLDGRGRTLSIYETSLGEVPGLERYAPPLPLPPPAARNRVFGFLAETVAAFARHEPFLLVIDDLQWADELSLAFLASLTPEWLRATPVQILCTYRLGEGGEAVRRLVEAPHATRVLLPRLGPSAVGAMVADMLAFASTPEPFLRFLARHTEGNPFFVAEYVRAAVAERVIRRDRQGRWRIEAVAPGAGEEGYQALPLPRSLVELIEQRLDGLSAAARALVDWGAVLGREMETEVLLAAAGLEEPAGSAALAELFVRTLFEAAEGDRVRFAHDKLQEVAYRSIEAGRRAAMHLAVARAIEAHGRDRRGFARQYAALGQHFGLAGAHDKALDYLALAADRARESHANDEAIGLYRAALAEADALAAAGPDQGQRLARRRALHERLGDLLSLTGRRAEARAAFAAALQRIDQPDPPDRPGEVDRARLHRKIGKCFEVEHQHAEALGAYGQALAALAPPSEGTGAAGGEAGGEAGPLASSDPSWREEYIQVHMDQAWVYYYTDRLPDMNALVDKLRPLVAASSSPRQRALFHQGQLQVALRRDRYRVAPRTLEDARAGLAAALESGDFAEIPMFHFMAGFVLCLDGQLDEADRELRAGLALGERAGDVALQARCLTYLTVASRLAGRRADTASWNERARAVALAARMRDYVGAAHANQAWLAWIEGDAAAVVRESDAARALWAQLSLVYPFHWLALTPRLALIAEGGGAEAGGAAGADLAPGAPAREVALACARALLDPQQQALGPGLTAALEALVASVDAPAAALQAGLDAVVARCREQGLL